MYSMTGYGDASVSCPCGNFRVEISSVNHRFREISLKLPPECTMLEWKIKKYVEKQVNRGRVNVFIRWEQKTLSRKVNVDNKVAGAYLSALRKVAREFHLKDDVGISFLAGLPEVVRIEQTAIDVDNLWTYVRKGIGEACDSFLAMRKKDGEVTGKALENSLTVIVKKLRNVDGRAGSVARGYKRLLLKKVKEIASGVDEAQLVREIAILVQRMDIDEETSRLSGLIEQFSGTVRKGRDVGRKLDFLIQEMNREANTIGAKSNDLRISRDVVDIKTELQKMREQVQNVE